MLSDEGCVSLSVGPVILTIDIGSWFYIIHSHSAPTADPLGNVSRLASAAVCMIVEVAVAIVGPVYIRVPAKGDIASFDSVVVD